MPYAKCVTPEQQNALEELKSRVKNALASTTLLEDDAIFYKFLKAQGFNVDKAEKLLRKHIVWRQVHEVDTILETFKPKEVFVKYVEPSVIGFDKDGDIVTYIASGRINNTELFKCIKLNDCIKHWIWFAEKLTSLNKQRGKKRPNAKFIGASDEGQTFHPVYYITPADMLHGPVELSLMDFSEYARMETFLTGIKAPVSLIVDLDKLELANATSRETANLFLRLAHLLRENYATRLKAGYIINAPSYYVIVFAVFKAVISNALIQRIHVFGHNGWKEKILEAIDADVLPAFLGGSRTDPDGDPYCKSFITLPGKIPESYYLSEKERYLNDPAKANRLIIPSSEKKEISVYVEKAGSLIRWQFMVMHKSIGFGLFYQTSTEYLKQIIPIYEYDTSDGTEENSYKCSSKGKYIIIFDNSKSRFTTKEVQYIVSVQNSET